MYLVFETNVRKANEERKKKDGEFDGEVMILRRMKNERILCLTS